MATKTSLHQSRYSLHKYWGKKPSKGLRPLIDKYSSEGDVVLDPFAGYGVFCCEAYLKERNVIINDLNPIANLIEAVLLEKNIDLGLTLRFWNEIKGEYKKYIDNWYSIEIDGEWYEPISVLRNNKDVPLMFTFRKGQKP